MQNPDHIKSKCPTCGAGRGLPCRTRSGDVALKVHYGRPYWSSKVGQPSSSRARYVQEIASEVESRRYPN